LCITANTDGSIQAHGKQIHLQFWDTAGQERFRSVTKSFFRDAIGFILMFDLTQETSFVNVRSWLTQLKANAYCDDPPIVLIGNKIDLDDQRAVEQVSAIALAEQIGVKYLETSVLTGQVVNEAVDTLLQVIIERMENEVTISQDCVDDTPRSRPRMVARKITLIDGYYFDDEEKRERASNCSC